MSLVRGRGRGWGSRVRGSRGRPLQVLVEDGFEPLGRARRIRSSEGPSRAGRAGTRAPRYPRPIFRSSKAMPLSWGRGCRRRVRAELPLSNCPLRREPMTPGRARVTQQRQMAFFAKTLLGFVDHQVLSAFLSLLRREASYFQNTLLAGPGCSRCALSQDRKLQILSARFGRDRTLAQERAE
jgi:hypothetical protein